MNGPIFHSYMKNWNDELARQRRHILLLIDNAPSHIVDEYSNIKIQFLPPNTTSKIQPLDQGIIRSVKCAYRKTIQVQYCSCVCRCMYMYLVYNFVSKYIHIYLLFTTSCFKTINKFNMVIYGCYTYFRKIAVNTIE